MLKLKRIIIIFRFGTPLFISKVSKEFNIELNVESVFCYSTIDAYTDYIYDILNSNIKENSHMKNSYTQNKSEINEKIAIIGMSCRFPGGANNPDEFWELLTSGETGVKVVPEDRWNIDEYNSSNKDEPGKVYVKKGGYLNVSIKEFDPLFFNIFPKEAMSMDPLQRLLLELIWEAYERSGIKINEFNGSNTGVYLGIAGEEY